MRCKIAIAAFTAVVIASLQPITPAGAEHKCEETGSQCTIIYHGHRSRDIVDWSPSLYEVTEDNTWRKGSASNTGSYDYMYASGGRDLDDYAQWRFSKAHDGSPIRGIFSIEVRVPDNSATVPATAAVEYSVSIQEDRDNEHTLSTSFVIDQRHQRGWVDSGRVLTLSAPHQVQVTLTDQAAWPDWQNGRTAHSVVAADAIRLRHIKLLPSDREYAQTQCAANTVHGRRINLHKEIDHLQPIRGVNAAIATSSAALSLLSLGPVGLGIITAIALADPLSELIYGTTILGEIGKIAENNRRAEVRAVINGSRFGGRWYAGSGLFGNNPRYLSFPNQGPCELLEDFDRYLPAGA